MAGPRQASRRPTPTRDDDARIEAMTAAYLAVGEAGSRDAARLEREMNDALERRAEAILLQIGQPADTE